jgi:hypothetical protein
MENLIPCKECDKWYKRISTTHLKSHNMSYDDYFKKYPGCSIEHPKVTELRKQTLENMIKRHGETEGQRRWELYCNRQAETNTFEYKNFRYGMTMEEFQEYNKSITKNLLASTDKIHKIYKTIDDYINRRSYNKTGKTMPMRGSDNPNFGIGYYQRWVDKYGKEIADEMNKECSKRKDNKSLDYMVRTYGLEEGTRKYDEFYAANSKRSLELILKNHGKCIYNKHAIQYIEAYGKEHGYNFQHAENGGEVRILNYYVDGYDAENKVIFEYNESYHNRRDIKLKDERRLRRIASEVGLGWKIVIYWYNNKIEIINT